MSNRNSFSYTLTDRQQEVLSDILTGGNYVSMNVEHTKFAARADECTIAVYKSGKCLVQGKGAEEFVTFVLEPMVLQAAELGYEDILNPEAVAPHIGVDESGKGDFFGPLVVAGAYVDKPLADKMREMNVRDSKTITSDSKALDMGRDLRKLLGKRFTVIKIGPQAYNRLYAKMRNVNTILAWAHARAIENMLDVLPDCPRAISDQFGSKEQVQRALFQKGKRIELVQRHRAESDLAVAAASVIAREQFLRALYEMKVKHGLTFPKGASEAVKDVAAELIRKNGPTVLIETSKCHFKTTDVVLEKSNMTRAVLGEQGRVVSKPHVPWRRHGGHSRHADGDAAPAGDSGAGAQDAD